MRGRAVGQVAGVALLRWHRDYFPPKLNSGPRATGRYRRAPRIFAALGKSSPGLDQIGHQPYRHPHNLAVAGIEPMQIARLLQKNVVAMDGNIQNRKVGELRHLSHGFGGWVIDKQVVFPRPIRPKNHLAAIPIGVQVVAAAFRLRNFLNRMRGSIVNPYPRMGTTTIVLPLTRHITMRAIRDFCAIG